MDSSPANSVKRFMMHDWHGLVTGRPWTEASDWSWKRGTIWD